MAGTIILAADGEKPIEQIQVGDEVYAYNDSTGQVELKIVTDIFSYIRDTIYMVYYSDEVVETTSDHPFYVNGQYVRVDQLQIGDILYTKYGKELTVDSINIALTQKRVYNFTVDSLHNYFVGGAGVLVHNSRICDISKKLRRNSYQAGTRDPDLKPGVKIKTKKSTEMVSEWRRPIMKSNIKDLRENFLGTDFVKVDKGKWISIDGKRMFRSVPADYLGQHGMGMPTVPGQSHVHLEFLRKTPSGNYVVTKNVHIPIKN